MKPIFIFSFIMMLLLVNLSYALVQCYQESADIPNQVGTDGSCSLNYSGTTNDFLLGGLTGWWAMNETYIKPPLALSAKVRFRGGLQGIINDTYYNVPSSCWNYDNTSIIIQSRSEHAYTNGGELALRCFNGVSMTVIHSEWCGGTSSVGGTSGTANVWYDGNWTNWGLYVAWPFNVFRVGDSTALSVNETMGCAIWETGVQWTLNICYSNWTCGRYSDCYPDGHRECREYVDLNDCGVPFTGNTTAFNIACPSTGGIDTMGWDLVMDGNLVGAVFAMFNVAFAGWFLFALFFVYEVMLFLKTQSVMLSFITLLIFGSMFYAAGLVSGATQIAVYAFFGIILLAGLFYAWFHK